MKRVGHSLGHSINSMSRQYSLKINNNVKNNFNEQNINILSNDGINVTDFSFYLELQYDLARRCPSPIFNNFGILLIMDILH